MKISKFILLFSVLTGLISCDLARFDRVPGTVLKEIPENLRGEYVAGSTRKAVPGDSIYFKVMTDSIVCTEQERTSAFAVNKSCYVSEYKGNLFFSQIKPEDSSFVVFQLKPGKDGVRVVPVVSEKQTDFGKYFPHYSVSFSDTSLKIYRMDEEALLRYFSKEYANRDGMELHRLP